MVRPTASLAVLLFCAVAAAPARGAIVVDVALVLAVDVSLSIDAEEFALVGPSLASSKACLNCSSLTGLSAQASAERRYVRALRKIWNLTDFKRK